VQPRCGARQAALVRDRPEVLQVVVIETRHRLILFNGLLEFMNWSER
jgi:hypothetical protein